MWNANVYNGIQNPLYAPNLMNTQDKVDALMCSQTPFTANSMFPLAPIPRTFKFTSS